MKIEELKKTKDLDVEWKVTIPALVINNELDKKYLEIQRDVKIPGFRQGKVPLNIIKDRSLNKEHNLTMIMVTHQMGFAREISDRVCFFNEGKIFEQGPPEQLFGDPKNDRTKQFLHAVLDAN